MKHLNSFLLFVVLPVFVGSVAVVAHRSYGQTSPGAPSSLAALNNPAQSQCYTFDEPTGTGVWKDCITPPGPPTFDARKGSAGTLTPGTPIAIVGFSAGFLEVEMADADDPTLFPAAGVVLTVVTDTVEGEVIHQGIIDGLDTSLFSVGEELFISTSPGVLIDTVPSVFGQCQQVVAYVFEVDVSDGSILVVGSNECRNAPKGAFVTIFETDDSCSTTLNTGSIGTFAGWTTASLSVNSGMTVDLADAAGDSIAVPVTGTYAVSFSTDFTGTNNADVIVGVTENGTIMDNRRHRTIGAANRKGSVGGDGSFWSFAAGTVLRLEVDSDNNNDDINICHFSLSVSLVSQ